MGSKAHYKEVQEIGEKDMASTGGYINDMVMERLVANVLDSGIILVAQTNIELATLLYSNLDRIDHTFILGCTNSNDILSNQSVTTTSDASGWKRSIVSLRG